MRTRREFVSLLGSAAAAWPLPSVAQDKSRIRRLGALFGSGDPSDPDSTAKIVFEKALRELGWIPGRNIEIEYRWARGDTDLSLKYATELIGRAPDLVLASTNTAMAALQRAKATMPIVFVMVSDPIGMGYVDSFARPGRNATGFTPFEPSLGSKWLSLLKDVAPRIEHIGLMFNPEPGNNSASFTSSIETVASSMGIKSIVKPEKDSAEIEQIILNLGRTENGGLIFLPDALTYVLRYRIVDLVGRSRLPAIYPLRRFSQIGGLMSYGIDVDRLYVQSASYVDRILRGTDVRDLPVQAPTKFEFVINVKTAKGLGLTVPDKHLIAADEVIE